MNEKKDIERLYTERFKDFQERPQKDLWSSIEASLPKEESKRRIVPLLRTLASVAAVLLLLIAGTLAYFNSGEAVNTQPVNQRSDTAPVVNNEVATPEMEPQNVTEPSGGPAIVKSEVTPENETGIQNPETTTESGIAAAGENESNKEPFSAYGNEILKKYARLQLIQGISSVSGNEFISKDGKDDRELAISIEKAREELQADNTESNTAENDKAQKNRWSLNPFAGPVYYNSLATGSPIDRQFSDNTKEGRINMSYGLNVTYEVSNRWSLRTGVNKIDMGYNTAGVEFSPEVNASLMENISYNGNVPFLTISDSGSRPKGGTNEVSARTPVYNGSLTQQLGYLEVPLEIKYRMVDSKFGVNLIGGMSSLILTDNEIGLTSGELQTTVGEANNLNPFNLSTNLGIGFDYRVTERMLFNLEPMFKYQWNTFSGNDGGFRPYILGVYTGFSFRF
ncbi:outer membrane beta-barrel protein [Robertkochia aurantiaca]|uniref:outer membrane beta-barrel protein n=1 Tax=Robertkochia aurantiaca TaxID=2873700 RepID=UPI001CCB1B8E|nr:outer membrane beta-barrel protein [Robertkochia sp. 3YJGBD-33]